MKTLVLLGAALASTFAIAACNKVETHFDCREICQKYHDCYDTSYDVEACKDRCESMPGTEDQRQAVADTCEDCVDGKACAQATFQCSTECATIVP